MRVLDHRRASEATLDAVKLLDLVTTITPNQFIVYAQIILALSSYACVYMRVRVFVSVCTMCILHMFV